MSCAGDGRRHDVLDTAAAAALLDTLPRPKLCDLCRVGPPRNPRAYGPFTVWLCTDCAANLDVRNMALRAAGCPPVGGGSSPAARR